MDLFIIRHGQTNLNKNGIPQGSIDVPLNDVGIEQAKKLAECLKNSKIDLIFSSPLKRALTTAKIVNEYHNSPIITSELIVERNFGAIEGKSISKEEIIKLQDEIYDINNKDNQPYCIESLNNMLDRAKNFLTEIIDTYGNTDKKIYIIAHGALNLILLFLLGEITSSELSNFSMKNCCCYKIENPSIKNV